MEYDRDKVDEMVLALLWLTLAADHRAWKSHDWDALDRLHAKGYISDPKSKAKSVVLSEEGERRVLAPRRPVRPPHSAIAPPALPLAQARVDRARAYLLPSASAPLRPP